MGRYRASANLTQNGLTEMVISLGRCSKNVTVGVSVPSDSAVGAAVRLDASFDKGNSWTTSVSLSDVNAAIGAAYVASVGVGESANTQDRVFGATDIRIVRTDGNGGACRPVVTVSEN